MSDTSYQFDKSQRSLMERLFEPPAPGLALGLARATRRA